MEYYNIKTLSIKETTTSATKNLVAINIWVANDHLVYIGDCIGLPFTSTLRFPVISPFGVSEFAGWTHDKTKMPSSLIGKAGHPMSQHFSNQVTVPRALYHAQGHKRFIYLSAPDGSTDHISDIPIIKAKLLVR